jgi:hypothetical protein
VSQSKKRSAEDEQPPSEGPTGGSRETAGGDQSTDGAPPPKAVPPPRPDRPSLADFDKWIQKRALLTMGSVIVIAFLAKSFVPVRFAFTAGLLAGAAFLIGLYLIEFYHQRQGH